MFVNGHGSSSQAEITRSICCHCSLLSARVLCILWQDSYYILQPYTLQTVACIRYTLIEVQVTTDEDAHIITYTIRVTSSVRT